MGRVSARLSIAVAGDVPPTEFRIFTAGTVDTVKGQFVFDEKAAQSVMAAYEAHGIDLMVDYDHASLSPIPLDPALSGKSAGWFCLEVRNGELWAVNVRWTEPAAAALSRKEWRFMSPAFEVEDNRITALLNVALTNLPATRRLQPLMAANVITQLGAGMDPNLIGKALDALVAGDAEQCAEILKNLIASAAAGTDPDATTEDAPPPAGDGGADETTEPPPAMAASEERDAAVAAVSRLTHLTGKTTIAAAVDEVEAWRQSHLKLETETQRLAKERATIELGERKSLVVQLISLGAETPHTSGLAKQKLVKRLAEEPLVELRERVKSLLSAKGGKLPETPKVPTGDASQFETPHGPYALSAQELAKCAAKKIDPAKYAANRAAIKSRNNVNGTGA